MAVTSGQLTAGDRSDDRFATQMREDELVLCWRLLRLCKGKFIFVLACLLAWTSTDCAVLCASQCSDVSTTQAPSSESPCHHHHQSGDRGKGGPAPCNHSAVQTGIPPSFEKAAVVSGVPAMELPSALPVPQWPASMTLSPPHDPPPLRDPGIQLSVVLRI